MAVDARGKGREVPLADPPLPPKYATPNLKFVSLGAESTQAKLERQFRKYELERGHNVRVEHQDDAHGLVLVCVATHRACPYHVCTQRVPPLPADAQYWRIIPTPFCVTHNHPPLYPIPTLLTPPIPAPTPPPHFADFLYSVSPQLSVYLPRLASQGITEDYAPAALGALDDKDLAPLLEATGMKVFEVQAVLKGLRSGLEKRKRDMVALDRDPDEDDDGYYVDGEIVDPRWENWVADVLHKSRAIKKDALAASGVGKMEH